ncbi:hypothetical protein Fmac_025686 [Flemingia macrophylla]|uniref:Uncharacterized protein n=1 Tax=Flemingia macrophylla TaxID=520843 RepID=A0ABD1LTL6_9FABA
MNGGELQHIDSVLPVEDLVESKHGVEKDASKEDISSQYANNVMPMAMNTKIVEVDFEEIVQSEVEDKEVKDIPKKEVDNTSAPRDKRSVYISLEVELALEILDKAISIVRERQLHSRASSSSIADEESSCKENDGRVDRKGVLFIDFQPVLQLQLKQFEYDFTRDMMVKIDDRYEFPSQLDLDRDNGKYLSPEADRSICNLYTLHRYLK